jgi:HEPN domain-containing protein
MIADKTKYWIELSDYDYETAVAMQKTKRYLYVGFMAHQCIEKIIKAFYTKHHTASPPYSHSLSYLSSKAGLSKLLSEEQKDFIDEIEPLNIEARYPSYKEILLKSLTKERCIYILKKLKTFNNG